MNRCERCEPLILDHLYGLLDEAEEALVESHLAECATCARARDEAARVQGLFARAARGAFPQVRFEAPSATPAAAAPRSPAPVTATPASTLPAPAGRSMGIGVLLPWAVAAAVLLAIPGTVIPVLNTLKRADTARRDAGESIDKLAPLTALADQARQNIDEPRRAAQRELAIRTQELDRVLTGWIAAEKDKLARGRATGVDVLKPASLQPGAPNELAIVVRDGQAAGRGNLTAEIREVRGEGAQRTDAVIYSQPLKSSSLEPQPLRLPAETWAKLTPQSELYLAVTSEDPKTRAKSEVQERIRLFGPVYATMLVTDKPTYRPGETLFFRSLTLDRVSLRPPSREQVLTYELFDRDKKRQPFPVASATGGTDLVRVTEGRVEPVLVNGKPVQGVGCGAFALPPDLSDGDYTLVLREQTNPAGYPPAIPEPVVRPFKVRSTPADQYEKRTYFSAASYGAGETVTGCAELFFQGKPVAGAAVEAVATADNVEFGSIQIQPTTGRDGRVELQFTLPPELDRGDVRLQVRFTTKQGGKDVEEVIAERVPVVGRSVLVEFFPEGGELVAGVPCRVYFRATTPAGEPVDIRGVLTDGRRTLAEISTVTGDVEGVNRGIGSFTFTPEIGQSVWVKLTGPVGMHAPIIVPNRRDFPVAASAAASAPLAVAARSGFLLPAAKAEGVAMTVLDPVTAPGEPIRVHLRSVGHARKLVVGAYTRGRLSDTQRVAVEPNEVREVRLMANASPRGGVVRITVFEEPSEEALGRVKAGEPKPDLKPVAERLVFRKPGESLNLGYTITGARGPGSATELDITATDEKGNPAAAVLFAAAVNSGVARGAKDRLLTTHFLIAGEVTTPDGLEHADFLLTDHPQAPVVLDLVLATQGWRRFAEQTPQGYVRRPRAPTEERKNLLVINGQYSVWADPAALRDERRQREAILPRYEAAKKARDNAQSALAAAKADRSAEDRAAKLSAEVEAARAEARELSARAEAAALPVARFREAGWYGVAGFGLLALMLGGLCLARPAVRLPLGIGSAGAIGLVAFLVVALGSAEKTQAATRDQSLPPRADRVDFASGSETENAAAGGKFDDVARKKSEKPSDMMDAPTMVRPGARGANELTPPTGGLGGAKRGKMAAGDPGREPRLPSVQEFAGGAGGAGAMAGGGRKMPPVPPKPSPVPSPLPTPEPPKSAAQFGALGVKPMAKQVRSELKIPLGGSTADNRMYGLGERTPAPGPAPVPPAAAALGGLAAAPGDVRMGLSVQRFGDSAERAKKFAQKRANEATELMLDSLARRQNVPPEEFRRSLDRLRANSGWVPKDEAPATVNLEDAKAYFLFEQSVPKVTPLVVREYAAPRPSTDEMGLDSRDTVLWQPVIVLPSDGKAKLQFHLGDAPGGYQVVVAGHTLDGRIGAVRGIIPVTPPQLTTPGAPPGQPAPIPPPAP